VVVPLVDLDDRHLETLVGYAKRKVRVWETVIVSFERELYDRRLIDMAGDPFNGAAKDVTMMPAPAAIRCTLAESNQLTIIVPGQ
jgi:hypothetical protein